MVVLAFTTLSMNAQENSKFAFKAGFGLTSVEGHDVDCKNKFAFKLGLSYDCGISKHFSIIPGIEFVNKGCSNFGMDEDIHLYYVQLPVLVAFKFDLNENVKLTLSAGHYLAYGVNGSELDFGYYTCDAFDFCDRVDAGVMTGMTLAIDKFTIGAEYSRSISRLHSDYSAYNQAYGITVGYKF